MDGRFRIQVQRAGDEQRDDDRPGIKREDVLQPKGGEFRRGGNDVYGVLGLGRHEVLLVTEAKLTALTVEVDTSRRQSVREQSHDRGWIAPEQKRTGGLYESSYQQSMMTGL